MSQTPVEAISSFRELCARWPEVVGAQLAAVTRPRAFMRVDGLGTLIIDVTSERWYDELSGMGLEFLIAMPGMLGATPIEAVRWTQPFTGEPHHG